MDSRLDRVVLLRARAWAANGAGDVDDLAQEARIALLDAVPRWRADGGATLETYVARVCDRRFSKLLREATRQRRRPGIWVERDGTRKWVPCQTVSFDPMYSDTSPSPEDALISREQEQERARIVAEVLARIRAQLAPAQVRVLDAYLDPPAALCIAARNLGHSGVGPSSIALYLGLPESVVMTALRRARRWAVVEVDAVLKESRS
jgi:RNA polymerase sigma factor (sigma-70 family)